MQFVDDGWINNEQEVEGLRNPPDAASVMDSGIVALTSGATFIFKTGEFLWFNVDDRPVNGSAGPDFQHRYGLRMDRRTKNETGRPEQNQAANDRDEGENGMQPEPVPCQDRTQQVVDCADDNHTPQHESQSFKETTASEECVTAASEPWTHFGAKNDFRHFCVNRKKRSETGCVPCDERQKCVNVLNWDSGAILYPRDAT